jgi:hypothetical protein
VQLGKRAAPAATGRAIAGTAQRQTAPPQTAAVQRRGLCHKVYNASNERISESLGCEGRLDQGRFSPSHHMLLCWQQARQQHSTQHCSRQRHSACQLLGHGVDVTACAFVCFKTGLGQSDREHCYSAANGSQSVGKGCSATRMHDRCAICMFVIVF